MGIIIMKTAKAIVITDRTEERIQPEIFYSFKTASNRLPVEDRLTFKFYNFNPYMIEFEEPLSFARAKQRIMDLLNNCVDTVVNIKKKTSNGQPLIQAILVYIEENIDSPISVLNNEIKKMMDDFTFLVIESTATTVIHPIFYKPEVLDIKSGAAVADDIKDTLYALFFLEAAFSQDKPVFGTCHGAQAAYLLAGGGLTKVFKQKGLPYSDTFYARENPNNGTKELWQIDVELNTRDRKDFHNFQTVKYPLPEIFKSQNAIGEQKWVNKDFRHTLAMTDPVPDSVDVLSYHPLSKNQRKEKAVDSFEIQGDYFASPEKVNKFKSTLKDITIVDAFKYKTLIGFQYHPHYTFDEFDTSEIFDYFIQKIIKVLKD